MLKPKPKLFLFKIIHRPSSRSGSRSGSRPTSRASRLGMRTPGLKGIGEDEEFDEDEWEYYYEDDEEEELNR